MAKRRRYDDEFRASAVVMLESAGYPEGEGALTRIANHLKMPRETLRRWALAKNNPPPPKLVTEKRLDLATLLRREIEAALEDMPDARQDAGYRDLGTVAAILIDKLQLLEGKPTERTAFMTEETGLASEFEHLVNRASSRVASGSEDVGS